MLLRENRQGNSAPGRPNTEGTVCADGRVLLRRAVKGDRQAFAALLEEHYDMIFCAAFKWTGNREDSEDIAQDVCIKVGRAIRTFRMDCKFTTWLYRIVLNTMKDHGRKKKYHEDIDDIKETHALSGDDASPEDHAERTQLWRLVRRLPAKQRDAVLLVYAEDLSHGEVAEVMECAENTVSWYIHEAKKQLKVLMNDHE